MNKILFWGLIVAAVVTGGAILGFPLYGLVKLCIKWSHLRSERGFITVNEIDPICEQPTDTWQGVVQPQKPSKPRHSTDAPRVVSLSQFEARAGSDIEMGEIDHRHISDSDIEYSILKGKSAAIHNFPWTVAIGSQWWPLWWTGARGPNQIVRTHCTGTLIRRGWVLTASHCVRSYFHRYWITAGTDCLPELGGYIQKTAQTKRVRRVFRFQTKWRPGWSSRDSLFTALSTGEKRSKESRIEWMKRDFALLQLEKPFFDGPASRGSIVPLPMEAEAQTGPVDLRRIHVSGWGFTHRENKASPRLQAMSFTDPPLIQQQVSQFLSQDQTLAADCQQDLYCADVHARASPQAGDSGAPWAAPRQGTSGTSADHWVLLATHAGGLGAKNYQPNDMDDEEEAMAGEGSNAPSESFKSQAIEYDFSMGVRLNDEKVSWVAQKIRRAESWIGHFW